MQPPRGFAVQALGCTTLAATLAITSATFTQAQLTPVGGQFRVDTNAGGFQSGGGGVRHFSNGDFIVVWPDNSFQEFSRLQRFNADGTPSGTEFGIEPAGFRGDVATPDSGNLIAIGQNTSTFTDLIGQIYDSAGNAIGTEFTVNTYTAQDRRQENPRIEPLPGGNFVVAWKSNYGFGYNVESDIRGQRFNSSGGFVGTEFLISDSTARGYGSPVKVSADPSGGFVVVWATLPPPGGGANGGDVRARVYDAAGAAVTGAFSVNVTTADTDSQPAVSKRSDGGFVVAWSRAGGDPDGAILARTFDANGTPQSAEIAVNAYVTGDQSRPEVETGADGGFVVTWASDGQDGFGNAIVTRSFDAAGAPQGTEFVVNSYTQSDQDYASVSSDGSGNFVIVWNGDRAGYSYGFDFPTGIAGQRYTRQGGSGGIPVLNLAIDTNGLTWSEATPFVVPYTASAQTGGFTGVVISAVVPVNTTFTAASSSAGWSCADGAAAGSVCTFTVGTLGDGQNSTAEFAATVDPGTPLSWDIYVRGNINGTAIPSFTSPRSTRVAISANSSIASASCGLTPSSQGCSFCFCWLTQGCGSLLVDSAVAAATDMLTLLRGIGGTPPLSDFFKLRDDVLLPRRGGARASELFTEHSAGLTNAMFTNATIATNTSDFLTAFESHVADLLAGNGGSAVITQQQVDSLATLLDALIAAADGGTSEAIQRERMRVNPDSWVGLTMTEALATFENLSCTGFETRLYCGEVTGDCSITATDALIILQIAVGAVPDDRPESDVDGSGATVATDALRALSIAVGADQETDECDPVP